MRSRSITDVCSRAVDALSTLCALFMLCVVPLLFHDAFFDINRVKVNAVLAAAPVFAGLTALCVLAHPHRKALFRGAGLPLALLGALLLACVLSCARTGFELTTLTGTAGRRCGLLFMLACGMAFAVIGLGRVNLRAFLLPAMLSAGACAALGVANAAGVDPLGFYARIQPGQERIFLSTIGNNDFFGAFMVMVFPISAAQFIFAEEKATRMLGLACAVTIALGAMAAHTDSALVSLHMACLMLTALSGGCLRRMARALLVWAAAFIALPVMSMALLKSPFEPNVTGAMEILFVFNVGEWMALLLLALAILCAWMHKRGKKAPSRKIVMRALLGAFAAAVLAVIAVIVYFSAVDTQKELGAAALLLRFNDRWGSSRGFVWMRALRAFADFDMMDKLFGAGMEQALRVLAPYFDDPARLAYGVFNDAHCQPLQMLLTCGLLGMAAFVTLYGGMLLWIARRAGEDPVLCAALASLFAYGLIMLLNVTQPILISTYFSMAALGVSRLRAVQANAVTGKEA